MATVIIRNSSFEANREEREGGVVMHLDDFTHVAVEGDEKFFEANSYNADGAVVAATTNTLLRIQGGTFRQNTAKVGPFSDRYTYIFRGPQALS